jgi:DNA-binding MarR family transcriptional regulator
LLHRAAQAAIWYANARLEEHGEGSVAQLATLSYVAERPGCSMTEIAEILDLNKSAVSSMCARLERAGVLRREPNPRDARGALLFSTTDGESIRKRSGVVFRTVMRDLTKGFSSREMDVVLRFLNAVVERCSSEPEARS